MKPVVLGTLIGPSFNSSQNPEAAVVAVDIQNVVAAKPKKNEVSTSTKKDEQPAVSVKTEKAKNQTKLEKPKDNVIASPPNASSQKAMTKEQRETWLQKSLSKSALDIDSIMELVAKTDPTWSRLSVIQYLKKPGMVKSTENGTAVYQYKP